MLSDFLPPCQIFKWFIFKVASLVGPFWQPWPEGGFDSYAQGSFLCEDITDLSLLWNDLIQQVNFSGNPENQNAEHVVDQ